MPRQLPPPPSFLRALRRLQRELEETIAHNWDDLPQKEQLEVCEALLRLSYLLREMDPPAPAEGGPGGPPLPPPEGNLPPVS